LDIRNNSAWNHRMFVWTKNNTSKLTTSIIENEIKFIMSSLVRVPHNESAWNYLSAIINDPSCSSTSRVDVEKSVISILSTNPDCWHALFYLADQWENSNETIFKQKAAEAYDLLANHLDKTRYKYWLWRKEQISI
jgi:protein farnesyltransferase/geranylgeranyltransferase type-1 subunit alpha